MRHLAPDWFERIAAYEDRFGRTIKRHCGLRQLANRGARTGLSLNNTNWRDAPCCAAGTSRQ